MNEPRCRKKPAGNPPWNPPQAPAPGPPYIRRHCSITSGTSGKILLCSRLLNVASVVRAEEVVIKTCGGSHWLQSAMAHPSGP